MPCDAIFLTAVINELRPAVVGARINKITQPDRDRLILSLRKNNENLKLLISATGNAGRIHLSKVQFANMETAPIFSMVLRKHIMGSEIVAINQPENERIAIIELAATDDLGIKTDKRLIVEMLGNATNIILTETDGTIVDCLKKVGYAADSKRRILPGSKYYLPEALNKLSLFSADAKAINAFTEGKTYINSNAVLKTFAGISPLIAREIEHQAEKQGDAAQAILKFSNIVKNNEFTPNLLLVDGKPFDFTYIPIEQYGNIGNNVKYDSWSNLLDKFYEERDKQEILKKVSAGIKKRVTTIKDREKRKLAIRKQELINTKDANKLRLKGELINANIWKIRKGDKYLICDNYYSEDCQQVKIDLKDDLSPGQNAQRYFKEYKKKCTAEAYLTILINESSDKIEYLSGVLSCIDVAKNPEDIAEISKELEEQGIISALKKKKSKSGSKKRELQRYVLKSGAEIFIGRNNIENELLTFKTANKSDIWLHSQGIHGSHVILRNTGEENFDSDLLVAAGAAAYYSAAGQSGKVSVDYTEVRNVKKHPCALPGMVIYKNYKTITAFPKSPFDEQPQ